MKLTLLSTSDVHGYVAPTTFHSRHQDDALGLSKDYTLMKEQKEKNPNTICIETGDFIQGSPFSYYIAKFKQDPSLLMQIPNAMGYDVGILGNHEFNYGSEYLKKAIEAANYPVLSANIIVEETGEPFTGNAYHIIEREGVKVAILGLTTEYIPHWEKPSHIEGLVFKNIVETAKEYVPKLRELADVVVVAYHGGFERDLETGEPTEMLTGENEGYRLLEEVEGIDAFMTGHQHRMIATHLHHVPVVQPGQKGQKVGKIDLEVEDHHVVSSTATLLSAEDAKADASILEMIHSLSDETEDWLDKPLGHVVEGNMEITDPHAARLKEHPYIEFINRVQMEATGTDISGTALFNNDGKGFGNEITMRDVVTNYVYPNTLAVLRVPGHVLKAALEKTATFYTLDESGQLAINPKFQEPKPMYYNYDMYEGIEYTIDVAKPEGSRIVSLTYQGEPVKMDETYDVAVNQYRAVGGGNYNMFGAEYIVSEVQKDMTELIADYLLAHENIKATTNDNFHVIVNNK